MPYAITLSLSTRTCGRLLYNYYITSGDRVLHVYERKNAIGSIQSEYLNSRIQKITSGIVLTTFLFCLF